MVLAGATGEHDANEASFVLECCHRATRTDDPDVGRRPTSKHQAGVRRGEEPLPILGNT